MQINSLSLFSPSSFHLSEAFLIIASPTRTSSYPPNPSQKNYTQDILKMILKNQLVIN